MRKEMFKLFIFSNIFSVVFIFVQLFVNLYIWSENKSITDLAWFNISQYVFWCIAYVLGSILFYKTKLTIVMNLSSVFSVLLFVFLSFNFIDNHFVLTLCSGGLFGIAKGMYSAGNEIALGLVGKGEEFTNYFQKLDLWNKNINVFVPIVSGLLLVFFDNKVLFIVMLFFSLILIFLSNGLPKIQPKEMLGEGNLFKGLSPWKVFKGKRNNKLVLSYLVGGMVPEFQAVFLLYFTFSISSTEIIVAALNVLYTLLTYICIRIYRKSNIKDELWLFVGIILVFIGMILAMFLHNWWMVIPNILLVFGNFYFRNIYYSQQFQAINDEKPLMKFQIIFWRDVLILLSRIILLLLILFLNQFTEIDNYIIWLMIFVLVNALCIPFIHKSFSIKSSK